MTERYLDASGAGDGIWAGAETAFITAFAAWNTGDEIHVRGGTYETAQDYCDNINKAFTLILHGDVIVDASNASSQRPLYVRGNPLTVTSNDGSARMITFKDSSTSGYDFLIDDAFTAEYPVTVCLEALNGGIQLGSTNSAWRTWQARMLMKAVNKSWLYTLSANAVQFSTDVLFVDGARSSYLGCTSASQLIDIGCAVFTNKGGTQDAWIISQGTCAGTINVHNVLGFGVECIRGGAVGTWINGTNNAAGVTVTVGAGVVHGPAFTPSYFYGGLNIDTEGANFHQWDHGIKFKEAYKPGAIAFCVDDSLNETAVNDLIAIAEPYGIPVTWGLDNLATDFVGNASRIALAKSMIAGIHDIATHCKHEAAFDQKDLLDLIYTGAAGTATVTIVGTVLTTSLSDTSDTEFSINFAAMSLAELAAQITADANYTCTVTLTEGTGGGGVLADDVDAKALEDVSAVDISTTASLEWDGARLFQAEFIEATDIIEEQTGYRPTSIVWPVEVPHADLYNEALANGYTACRSVSGDGYAEKGINAAIFPGAAFNTTVLDIGTPDQRRQKGYAYLDTVANSGFYFASYMHSLSAGQLTAFSDFCALIDECTPVNFVTLAEAGRLLMANATSSSGDTYTVDPGTRWKTWVPELVADSPLNTEGYAYWGGAGNPQGADGEPFANINTTAGPVQSKDVLFHPARGKVV